jgi:hypothetical protein
MSQLKGYTGPEERFVPTPIRAEPVGRETFSAPSVIFVKVAEL